MSYRLKDGESPQKGLRRLVVEQIDKAIDRVKSPRQGAIHDVRVCFKKIRAVLRLVRFGLNDEFARENRFYRDLGRQLSSFRNDAAMVESADKLAARFKDQLARDAFDGLRRPLIRSKTHNRSERSSALREIARDLRTARRRVKKWPLEQAGLSDLRQGVKSVYGQGRQRFATARQDPSVENLHDWRKRVKNLWYEIRLLKPAWPLALRELASELEKLGNYLSDDHDLALLRKRVAKEHSGEEGGATLEAYIALIDQHRAELQLQADLLGARIYAEKPKAFAARFEAYWRAWRRQVRNAPTAVNARKGC